MSAKGCSCYVLDLSHADGNGHQIIEIIEIIKYTSTSQDAGKHVCKT